MLFPWTCPDCGQPFEDEKAMEDEEVTTKSAQTTHATQHKGHRHHVAVLYKDFIPISHHMADTLHTILNLGRQLLQEGVIVRIKTNE
ncbi:hypothetical protein CYMTET_25168 [Cymbomonas tetramitiformis]|uniref:C2H2-type domain-containing protein n=1 Tax=Cymbomonas tetramitiformis TaxID=36881 RepID=A0AAE0FUD7_9CHLO|nr:hypothetical protein CYMTET_25168 [Cymbomonas tetramitiformis]